MKNEKIWYELDAFAKTYSSIISEGRTTCFRLSALFSENIDLNQKEQIEIKNLKRGESLIIAENNKIIIKIISNELENNIIEGTLNENDEK